MRKCLSWLCSAVVLLAFSGCQQTSRDLPLDEQLAHSCIETALQAWVDGQSPEELKPEIVMGDVAWDEGKKLVSFEILTDAESSDGTNLHIPVIRKFKTGDKETQSQVTYIVGTSPVITIFPQ